MGLGRGKRCVKHKRNIRYLEGILIRDKEFIGDTRSTLYYLR